MPEYSNAEIPEGINVSQEHPLKEFFHLVVFVSIVLVASITILFTLSDYLVRYIPFEYEASIAEKVQPLLENPESATDEHIAVQTYLTDLSQQLSGHMSLPEQMQIKVHYIESDIVNAYATLDGNIIVYSGLIENLTSENGLAFVLAHELAHLAERHPIKSLGRGIVITISLAALAGISETSLPNWLFNTTGQGALLSYSRGMESDADSIAVNALMREYGHTGGATELFDFFLSKNKPLPPAFLSTHPNPKQRISDIRQLSESLKITDQPPIPLPEFVRKQQKPKSTTQ